jgi:2-C-methyl-D-erythritol 4-phosphate cytidylyltransferase/2-C-methyl-D-erythritol 2,4-cyclodiphosphate synthase
LLAGKPLIAHTVSRFNGIADSLTLIGRDEELARLRADCGSGDAVFVCGGATRQESVHRGLASLDASPDDIVLVHDGARPLVPRSAIERCIDAVRDCGSALAAVPVADTLKLSDSSDRVVETVDRDGLWFAQTPQGATFADLRHAFDRAAEEGFAGTDEASVLEHSFAGRRPKLVLGARENIKITTPEDLRFAERWLAAERASAPAVRVGIGYDIHRFAPDRRLVLGGVEIPGEVGLLGHSDADVVVHAICDAILGAAGMPDIGSLFPNSDARFAGISSLTLLQDVADRVRIAGFAVGNVDCCVVAERPKIALYVSKMRSAIARALSIGENGIGIKATTNEGIGALGAGEGIACHATATIMTV